MQPLVLFVQRFTREIAVFHFLHFSTNFLFTMEPEALCSWCKTPVGVRCYLGNRKTSVLRRKWAFFSKFLRQQHPSSQKYASLRLQYLSKISENAVPAHLRACLCYGSICLGQSKYQPCTACGIISPPQTIGVSARHPSTGDCVFCMYPPRG